jgi:hypothetical protein
MSDEPRRHPVFMLLLTLCALGTAPFLFIGAETRLVLGLPTWLWSSIFFTLALSALTAWGIVRYWKDDDDPGEGDA